ncbi:hypothetical protein TNCV_498661 [Trichonephila clavipes]|nr:hypothetical protein TNCV_498661 [Trichonephila clavipes]
MPAMVGYLNHWATAALLHTKVAIELFKDYDMLLFIEKGVRGGNSYYTGMWVRLGSTDLMAGKVMFLRSNQGGRFDDNESVADSFRGDLVNFKSSCTTILGAFFPLTSARKNLQSGSELATRGHPSVTPILIR